ncbi:MAG: hypothetical protein AB7F51_16890 [Pseudorhodoplanes sp.]
MSEGTNLSAGEIGGVFAGIVALLGAIGAGIRWLLGWQDRRRETFHARLLIWEEKLTQREATLEADKEHHFARIEQRLARAEGQQAALLSAYHLISGELRRLDPGNTKLGMADELLKAAFQLDPHVPADMLATLDRMGGQA